MRLLKRIAILVFVVFLAFGSGVALRQFKKQVVDRKSVAIRVEVPFEYVDYELLSLINFLEYLFEENNYSFKGVTYGGNMYSKDLDDAYINVFVRGYAQGFDKRVSDEKFDVFLVHRLGNLYQEEFRNYDYYLGIYKEVVDVLASLNNGKASVLPLGGAKNKLLKPNYKYDVLYICEFGEKYLNYLTNINPNSKMYNGFDFAKLSQKEREDELKSAKVVLYLANFEKDMRYVPYALFDIISYGRPVLVDSNHIKGSILEGKVVTYESWEMLPQRLNDILKQSDEDRENNAKKVRALLRKQNYKIDFFSKIL